MFWHLKVRMKADNIYFTFKKNKIFSNRLQRCSWKIFKFFFQKWKILIFRFFQHIHLEVVLPTSKYKKRIFWIIFSISCPENFFHRTFSFFSKRVWKSSKSHFFKKNRFFQKIQFWEFSSPFREKTKSPMKKISGTRNAQNYPKNLFFFT